MARIVHSQNGLLRYMQMSEAILFAFVEGKKIDPFFYGQICASACKQRQIKYALIKANELPPGAGGKPKLLKYYDYLLGRKKLSSNLGGKRAVAVFFLDKDIDDISKRWKKSRYIIYTRYYDVHNEIFLNGDLTQGCAAAASLDPTDLKPLFSNSSQWCVQAAARWKDWVVLCVITMLNCINHQCNYGVVSQIQSTVTGAVDAGKLELMKDRKSTRLSSSH